MSSLSNHLHLAASQEWCHVTQPADPSTSVMTAFLYKSCACALRESNSHLKCRFSAAATWELQVLKSLHQHISLSDQGLHLQGCRSPGVANFRIITRLRVPQRPGAKRATRLSPSHDTGQKHERWAYFGGKQTRDLPPSADSTTFQPWDFRDWICSISLLSGHSSLSARPALHRVICVCALGVFTPQRWSSHDISWVSGAGVLETGAATTARSDRRGSRIVEAWKLPRRAPAHPQPQRPAAGCRPAQSWAPCGRCGCRSPGSPCARHSGGPALHGGCSAGSAACLVAEP